MMIETLSPEQTKAALKLLIEDEKLKPEDLADAVKRCPTTEVKRMVDIVHNAMCKENHGLTEEDVVTCNYHQEDQEPNCWNQYDHQQWLDKTTELLGEVDLADERELLTAFQTVNQTLAKLDQVKGCRKLLELLLA